MLIGKRLKQIYYGNGTIVDANDNQVKVLYDKDRITRSYDYPKDLKEDYFEITDEELISQIEKDSIPKIEYSIDDRLISGRVDDGVRLAITVPETVTCLTRGTCYGESAKSIYSALCNNPHFNWNIEKANSFGPQRPLFSNDCTNEHYSVWFVRFSSYTGDRSETRGITNVIDPNVGCYDIVEYWDEEEIFERDRHRTDRGERIVTFVRNLNSQYIFWGIMETSEINPENKTIKQIHVSDTYEPEQQ